MSIFPLQIKVVLENAEVVNSLREALAAKEEQLKKLQADYNYLEYLYRCQTIMSCEMADELHAHGIKTRFKEPVFKG